MRVQTLACLWVQSFIHFEDELHRCICIIFGPWEKKKSITVLFAILLTISTTAIIEIVKGKITLERKTLYCLGCLFEVWINVDDNTTIKGSVIKMHMCFRKACWLIWDTPWLKAAIRILYKLTGDTFATKWCIRGHFWKKKNLRGF